MAMTRITRIQIERGYGLYVEAKNLHRAEEIKDRENAWGSAIHYELVGKSVAQ
jgi:hypothetical protein